MRLNYKNSLQLYLFVLQIMQKCSLVTHTTATYGYASALLGHIQQKNKGSTYHTFSG